MGKILLQKYELQKQIGQGAEGKVFLAKDLNLDRCVAIKEKQISKECMQEELRKEAELLREIKHPGLPLVYDLFEEAGSTYLVMEYVEGLSLRKYLEKNGRVKESTAVAWAAELCEILDCLHSLKPAVIYRDLKPENIMITPEGGIRLIDMGAAMRYVCGSVEEALCAGTPGYSPPEQWKENRGRLSWDVYSLGAVLHEMLTGKNPSFPPYERLPLRQYDQGFSRGLEKVISTCTEERPGKRYQSMKQLKQALEGHRRIGMGNRLFFSLGRCAAAGSFLAVFYSIVIPLLNGVKEQDFPFPFLKRPLIFGALFMGLEFLLQKAGKRGFLTAQEKNIWLTDKKFSGLYALLIFLMGALWGMGSFGGCGDPFQKKGMEAVVYAGENEERLWVEMRDDTGRKLLLKEGAVYEPIERVRFEIPTQRLPGGEIRVQLVAEQKGGQVYLSRVFLVNAGQQEE